MIPAQPIAEANVRLPRQPAPAAPLAVTRGQGGAVEHFIRRRLVEVVSQYQREAGGEVGQPTPRPIELGAAG